MHTTFGKRFVSILDNHEITAGPFDPAISKAVSFHFFGKPSYRPKLDDSYSRTIESSLFCVLLDFDTLPDPSSILPFDSGGYASRFQATCGGIDLGEFFMPTTKDIPRQLISAFFGSNSSYWSMKLRDGVSEEIKPFDLHSTSLVRLCTLPGPVPFDQRAFSIELHYEMPLNLRQLNVLAIAAPDTACEDTELIDFSALLNAELIPYPLELETSAAQQRQLRDAIFDWLTVKDYFK